MPVTVEDEALDLLEIQPSPTPRAHVSLRNHVSQVGRIRRLVEPVADPRVVVDRLDRELGVGAVEDLRRHLVRAAPGLEGLLVPGALEREGDGARILLRARPGEVETLRRLVDEVAQVALPALVVVAEKEQPLVGLEQEPLGEVDRRDRSELADVLEVVLARCDRRWRARAGAPKADLRPPRSGTTWVSAFCVPWSSVAAMAAKPSMSASVHCSWCPRTS